MTTQDDAHGSGPAPPVPEPQDSRSAQDLAALMFKPALDPVRRIPPAPGRPRASARPGLPPNLPVVYGARPMPPELAEPPALSEPPGAPEDPTEPATGASQGEPAPGDRSAQRSVIRHSRQFRRIAAVGGAALAVAVTAGLWGLVRIAVSWM